MKKLSHTDKLYLVKLADIMNITPGFDLVDDIPTNRGVPPRPAVPPTPMVEPGYGGSSSNPRVNLSPGPNNNARLVGPANASGRPPPTSTVRPPPTNASQFQPPTVRTPAGPPAVRTPTPSFTKPPIKNVTPTSTISQVVNRTSRLSPWLGRAGRLAGRAFLPLGAAYGIYDIWRNRDRIADIISNPGDVVEGLKYWAAGSPEYVAPAPVEDTTTNQQETNTEELNALKQEMEWLQSNGRVIPPNMQKRIDFLEGQVADPNVEGKKSVPTGTFESPTPLPEDVVRQNETKPAPTAPEPIKNPWLVEMDQGAPQTEEARQRQNAQDQRVADFARHTQEVGLHPVIENIPGKRTAKMTQEVPMVGPQPQGGTIEVGGRVYNPKFEGGAGFGDYSSEELTRAGVPQQNRAPSQSNSQAPAGKLDPNFKFADPGGSRNHVPKVEALRNNPWMKMD
jgi:hypothetical protein